MKARISQMATAFIIGMAVIVLLGWQFDIQLLKTGLTNTPVPMKPNTAICFLLCGISLGLWQMRGVRWGKTLAQALGWLVIAIASLTLVQYLFGWDLGIDQLLYQYLGKSSTVLYPLRIPETSAINFILAGTSLVLLGNRNKRRMQQVQMLPVLVGFIGLMPLIGYLFGATFFYQFIIPTTTTTLPTAITFIILSIGILLKSNDTELMQTLTSKMVGGVMVRRLLPWAIALPLIVNWMIFEGYQLQWYDIPSGYAYITSIKIVILSTLIYWVARELNRIEQGREAIFQQFYRAVLDSPLPLIIHAEDGAVLQISKAWTELTGYPPEQIPTIAAWTERAYGDNSENMRAMIKKVYRLEESASIGEFTVRTSDGSTRIWDFYTAPLGQTLDGRRFVITTAIDITSRKEAETAIKKINERLEFRVKFRTDELELANDRLEWELQERRRSEQALRDSKALLSSIIEGSKELIAAQDKEFKYIAFNRAYQQEFAQLFDRQVEIGTSMVEALAHLPREQAQAVEIWERALAGEEFTIIREFGASTNQPNWYEINFSAVRNADGRQIGASQIVKNVTHRVRDDMALRQSEARFQAFMNHIPAIAWISRTDGKFIYCNRNVELMLAQSAEELIGKMIWEFFPPKLAQQYLENNQFVADTGQVLETIESSHNSAGELVDFWVFKFPIPDAIDRGLVGGVGLDITERQKAEAAIREAKQAAEQANQAKSRFLANMSHELRTPMNAILGFTQVLARDSSLNQQQQEQIAIINSSGEHLLSLINDILEISKIEAGRMALNPSSFDLSAVIEQIQALLSSRAEAKGLQIICEVEPSTPRYVTTDEGKLRQVLSNLLGNAIKFTYSGSVALRVRADGTEDIPPEIQLSFEVSDTGPGIAADELEKLFAPFVQTQTGRSMQEGSGLGLAISRKLVQLMGGDMAISSAVGEGTLVKFHIPATVAAGDEVKITLAMPRVIGLEPGQPTYRILVVDDRRESRILLRQLLQPLGFEVREAQNGQEAIEQWQEWQPHLIWMDMRMPIMDGYEATRQIKSHLQGQATVIIALTASAFEENRSIIVSAGCNDFVRKPCREEVLLAKMTEHLGVRYIYEPIATSEGEDSFAAGVEQRAGGSSETALLEVMPREWIAALHQAAISANSRVILQLLEQIPQHEHHLALTFHSWVDNFRFDKITALTEDIVHE